MSDPKKPKSKFPMDGEEFDEEALTPFELSRLNATRPGRIIKKKATTPVTPVAAVPTWSPDNGKTVLLQTEADPKTGKRLLLD